MSFTGRPVATANMMSVEVNTASPINTPSSLTVKMNYGQQTHESGYFFDIVCPGSQPTRTYRFGRSSFNNVCINEEAICLWISGFRCAHSLRKDEDKYENLTCGLF
jgi:hypothetical protein